MRSRWFRRVLYAVLVLLASGILLFSVLRPDPVPVTVFLAARGRVEDTVTNSEAGTIRTRHRAALSPEVGGRVEALPAREGDRVRRGQVLMQLAAGEYRAQLALRERALETASARERESCETAGQAERELVRYRRLAEEQIVSPELLDQVQSRRDVASAACDAARAGVRESQAALEVARVNLTKTTLRAPFDGVLAEVSTQVGEWITPSPPGVPFPPVIELLDPGAIYVSAPLDEVDVGRIREGQPVRITLDAYPGRAFPGRLVRVAPYVLDVEEQNRTVEVEVEFEDAEFARTLLPGASADVEVVLEARDDVLRIPTYALIEGSRVLVVRDGVLAVAEVRTDLHNWQFTEIAEGLGPGDPVVVSLDRIEVHEGARVHIAGETLK